MTVSLGLQSSLLNHISEIKIRKITKKYFFHTSLIFLQYFFNISLIIRQISVKYSTKYDDWRWDRVMSQLIIVIFWKIMINNEKWLEILRNINLLKIFEVRIIIDLRRENYQSLAIYVIFILVSMDLVSFPFFHLYIGPWETRIHLT